MADSNQEILPLEQGVERECPNRDKSIAFESMPNFSSTPGGKNGVPMSFWASWELKDRPRRIALLLDDCQEEYRDFAEEILPNLVQLTNIFRSKKKAIAWSAWGRTYDDGISNSMDRWYGPRGLDPKNYQNAVYLAGGTDGLKPFKEIEPTPEEVQGGWFFLGKHLDMFWNFDENGKSYLDEKLKALGIDTIVLAGLWTDECITATAFAGNARGYDVAVVGDAVGTATHNQQAALTVMNGTIAKVLKTEDVVKYMSDDFVEGEVGQVKGVKYPDGRKDTPATSGLVSTRYPNKMATSPV